MPGLKRIAAAGQREEAGLRRFQNSREGKIVILSDISRYLRQHRRASLSDMVHGIGSTPQALEAMLMVLERKGRVRRLPAGSSCGASSCCKCDPSALTIYEWAGEGDQPADPAPRP
jgi:hypothetical protein